MSSIRLTLVYRLQEDRLCSNVEGCWRGDSFERLIFVIIKCDVRSLACFLDQFSILSVLILWASITELHYSERVHCRQHCCKNVYKLLK